jgi:uncharacterized protein (DUF952 family)
MDSPIKLIYHITTQSAWATAQATGQVETESLSSEGFIHCSRQGQLLAVADRFFPGASGLIVLGVNEEAVAPWLVNEGPAGPGEPFAQDVFPHVYGPIPISAVVAAAPLDAGVDGHFVWPVDLPGK